MYAIKSEVDRNCAELRTLLLSQILTVQLQAPEKNCTQIAITVSRHVPWMFRAVTTTGPKVIVANMLIFKAIFKCSFLKLLGDPRPR